MAEPVYPSLEEPGPGGQTTMIGLEELAAETKAEMQQQEEPVRVRVESKGVKSDEVGLLEPREEEEDTVYFKDGVSKIDFVLTYKDKVDKKGTEEEISESSAKRAAKRDSFFEALEVRGMKFETQDPKFYDGETYFVKCSASFRLLQKGAEELLIRMPIKEVDLPRKDKPWYRDIFDMIHVRDPFEFFDPKIPDKFQHADCFTAPYVKKNRAEFLNSDDEANFFSSAQRSAIVWFILENTAYGEKEDQVGISRLLQNGSFTSAFPLHDGSHRYKGGDKNYENERQVLYHEWSHPLSFYKYQPLENIRHYYGEKIGLYFAWVGHYTTWLLPASIIGVLIFIAGLYTLVLGNNPPAREICDENLRNFFYMCPLCDETCDFWYYITSCNFVRVSLLFDYGGTVFFAIFMACWAVLYMEFWKRQEASLQYEWDTLGYEAAEQRERPEFIQAIKRKIKDYPEEKKKRYRVYNVVLERYEYIQPSHILLPKLITAFSILMTMVAAVIGIVIAVLIYRLAVSSAIYRLIRTIPGGPSAADLIVSITGSCIQLIFIIIMNQIYERLATWLTSWELHRTSTNYEDSFTFKMYLFQFINFYSSIFYIAFFKGRLTGVPGDYVRFGQFRLDECASYGCLLELTIQLAIIFVGKQVLNDITELGVPYAKKIIKTVLRKRKEKDLEEEAVQVRWEKDFEMVPLSIHGLFFEYLELVIQYGFVTIFVAAFPLAPFFAWLNNVIEIRLDAHKFVTILRRPVAERAQDIGAWFHLLRFVTTLCVVTNAFLIAVTSQFIDREVFRYSYRDDVDECTNSTLIKNDNSENCGFVSWATSGIAMSRLLEPVRGSDTSFPIYTVQLLRAYNDNGEVITTDDGDEVLYLPFVNFDCLNMNGISLNASNVTESSYTDFYEGANSSLVFTVNGGVDQPIQQQVGECVNLQAQCRFRGQVDANGDFPLEYYQVWVAKLAFVIVFEHIIFMLSAVLDWLVPDVPQSVEDEIKREKLLSARLAAKTKEGAASPEPEPRDRTFTQESQDV